MDKKEIKINPSFLKYSNKSTKAKTQKIDKTKRIKRKLKKEAVRKELLGKVK